MAARQSGDKGLTLLANVDAEGGTIVNYDADLGHVDIESHDLRADESLSIRLSIAEMDELARNWMRLRMGANDDTRNRG